MSASGGRTGPIGRNTQERDAQEKLPWDERLEALARRCLAEGLVETGSDAFRHRALCVLRSLRPDASCAALSEALLPLRLKLVGQSGGVAPAWARSMDTLDGTI